MVTQPKLEAEEEEEAEAEAEGAGASVRHVLGDARHVLEGEAYFYSQQDFNFFYYPFDKQVLKHGSEYVAGSTRSFSYYP